MEINQNMIKFGNVGSYITEKSEYDYKKKLDKNDDGKLSDAISNVTSNKDKDLGLTVEKLADKKEVKNNKKEERARKKAEEKRYKAQIKFDKAKEKAIKAEEKRDETATKPSQNRLEKATEKAIKADRKADKAEKNLIKAIKDLEKLTVNDNEEINSSTVTFSVGIDKNKFAKQIMNAHKSGRITKEQTLKMLKNTNLDSLTDEELKEEIKNLKNTEDVEISSNKESDTKAKEYYTIDRNKWAKEVINIYKNGKATKEQALKMLKNMKINPDNITDEELKKAIKELE